jgi:predicted metal-dependent hydrolase
MHIMYGSQRIDYIVVERNRETVSVIVDPTDGVVVRAPRETDKSQIQQIVMKKAPWILKNLKSVGELVRTPSKKEFVSGESFSYLGRNYRLKVNKVKSETSRIRLVGGRFIINVDSLLNDEIQAKTVRHALVDWYMDHARARLVERVGIYAPKVDAHPSGIVIKKQLKRWGSCTKEGIVNFNWKIIMAPMSVVDYVVVHELCHLRNPSHSSAFWILLRSVLPDYEERRNWLRINGRRLSF